MKLNTLMDVVHSSSTPDTRFSINKMRAMTTATIARSSQGLFAGADAAVAVVVVVVVVVGVGRGTGLIGAAAVAVEAGAGAGAGTDIDVGTLSRVPGAFCTGLCTPSPPSDSPF